MPSPKLFPFPAAAAIAMLISPVLASAQGNHAAGPMAGEWFVKTERSLEFAMFGAPETDPVIALTCDPATRELVFALSDDRRGTHRFTLSSGNSSLSFDLVGDDNAVLPYLESTVDPAHAAVTAMARSGQSATLAYPDGTSVVIPSDPAIAPVLEACS